MDGWHACGPLCCFGALSSGDIELLEYAYPIIIHRYGLQQDSGGAGQHRGGSGTVWEVEPIGHEMTVVAFGEGRQIPTGGAAGAYNSLPERKLGRLEHRHADGQVTTHRKNTILKVTPGERARNVNPGGAATAIPIAARRWTWRATSATAWSRARPRRPSTASPSAPTASPT